MKLSRRQAIIAFAGAVVLLMLAGGIAAVANYVGRSHQRASSAITAGHNATSSASPSLSASESTGNPTATASGTATSASATPATTHAIPTASATGAWLVYDQAHGYPLLVNSDSTRASSELNGAMVLGPTTWKWDGVGWVTLNPATEPESFRSNLVYDPNLGKVIGIGRSAMWTWDGTTWSRTDVIPPVNGNATALMAFDEARNNLLLLVTNAPSQEESWTWDGKTWKRATGDIPPPALVRGLAYDPRSKTVLLTGGSDPSMGVALVSDTWSWNGTSWIHLHPLTSPPGGSSNLGYDNADQQMILVQTGNGGTAVWNWDGSNWTPIGSPQQPPQAGFHNLEYVPSLKSLLLVTFPPAYSPPSQTWTYANGSWTRQN